MELYTIEGFTRPKARLDPIFTLKREIVRFSSRLAEMSKNNPRWIPILRNHTSTIFVKQYIKRTYYDFVHSVDFDNRIFNLMLKESLGQSADYYVLEYSEHLLNRLNRLKYKPTFLPPPLYWDNKIIKSAYSNKFYGKIEKDCFSHSTLIVKQHDGTEVFFAILDKKPYDRFPIFTQPFLAAKNVEKHFTKYGTTFENTYNATKGLFNIWYGYRF